MSNEFFKNFSMNACSYREECKSIRNLLRADGGKYQSQHYWRALALQRKQRIEELEKWQKDVKDALSVARPFAYSTHSIPWKNVFYAAGIDNQFLSMQPVKGVTDEQ